MYIRLIFILSFLCTLSFSENIFAANGQSYTDYKNKSKEFCEDIKRDWNEGSNLVGVIDYSELDENSVNQTIANWRVKKEWSIGDEKTRLIEDLDPTRIGEYAGFKTLEVARIGYRSNMNRLFACAVVSSRIQTIDTLQAIIKEKVKTKNSEILKKLEREGNNLKDTQSKLLCNPDINTERDIIATLANSSTKQYCYYRHYLDYLDSNLTSNFRNIVEIEKNIGQGSGTIIPKNTEEWERINPIYSLDMSREIARSNKILPKAIKTFSEMDQTYGAHILLTFIYNDYIRLRKSLSTYMNLSSQLYQKAYNAQSTNK